MATQVLFPNAGDRNEVATCYGLMFNDQGQVRHISNAAFEDYLTANLDSYDFGAAALAASGHFSLAIPAAIPAGRYLIEGWKRVGGTPAETDNFLGYYWLQWDGDNIVEMNDLDAAIGAISAGGGPTVDDIATRLLVNPANKLTTDESGRVPVSGFAANAITSATIQDGAITVNKLADGAISNAKLADGAISLGKLAAGAIDNTKIADNAISAAKIADGAITAAKIASAALTSAKFASTALPSVYKKNQAVTGFQFFMVDDAGQPATNKTPTCLRAIDANVFVPRTNADPIVELGYGMYAINFDAVDMNGDSITFRFSAAGCRPTIRTIIPQV